MSKITIYQRGKFKVIGVESNYGIEKNIIQYQAKCGSMLLGTASNYTWANRHSSNPETFLRITLNEKKRKFNYDLKKAQDKVKKLSDKLRIIETAEALNGASNVS